MDNKYYVYCYLDPRKPSNKYRKFGFGFEPFYVGKGCGKRKTFHLREAELGKAYNRRIAKCRKILSLGLKPFIIMVKDNLSEQDAFDLEIKLIKQIGRKVKDKGPLLNIFPGGEGSSEENPGKRPEVRKKISDAGKRKVENGTHHFLKGNHSGKQWMDCKSPEERSAWVKEHTSSINRKRLLKDNPSRKEGIGERISKSILRRNKEEIESGVHIFQRNNPMRNYDSNHPNMLKRKRLFNFLAAIKEECVISNTFGYVCNSSFFKAIRKIIIEENLSIKLVLDVFTKKTVAKIIPI